MQIDRKEIKKPDAFLEKTILFLRYIQENVRVVVFSLVLVFSGGLGVAMYSNYKDKKNESANLALYQARKEIQQVLEKNPKTPLDMELKDPIARLSKLIYEHRGTHAEIEALFLLGDLYLEHRYETKGQENLQRALEYYKKVLDQSRKTELKAYAFYSMGFIYEELKDSVQAIASFEQALSTGIKNVRADTLLSLARNYELKGDKEKAKTQYMLLIQEFPNSGLSKIADINKNNL